MSCRWLFGRRRPARKFIRYRPEVTALEGRWLPSTITEFPLPPNGFMGTSFGTTAITGGRDGNLWFTDPVNVGKVGRITPAGQVTEFTPPSPDAGPHRFPSAPAVMASPVAKGAGNSVTWPAGVMRPILPAAGSVNQRLPSGPPVMGAV